MIQTDLPLVAAVPTSSPLTSRLASSIVLLVRLTSSWKRSFSDVAFSNAVVRVSRLLSSSWERGEEEQPKIWYPWIEPINLFVYSNIWVENPCFLSSFWWCYYKVYTTYSSKLQVWCFHVSLITTLSLTSGWRSHVSRHRQMKMTSWVYLKLEMSLRCCCWVDSVYQRQAKHRNVN